MNNKKRFQSWFKKWEKKEQKKLENLIDNYFFPNDEIYKTKTKEINLENDELDNVAINMIKNIIDNCNENKYVDKIEIKSCIKHKINNLKENKGVDNCDLFLENWNENIINEKYSNLITKDKEYPQKDSEYGILCGKVNMIKNLEFYQKWFLKNFLIQLKIENPIFNGMIVIHESENCATELILPILQCLFENDKDKIIVLTSYSGIMIMKQKFDEILIKNDLKQFQKRVEWYSYEIFYSKKTKMPSFEDSILILGDAHRLRKELLQRGKKRSEYLQNILIAIDKSKFILVCTETPFYKSFWDIISLYEIIYKPKNKELPKTFIEWLEKEYEIIINDLVEEMDNLEMFYKEGWMQDWFGIDELKNTISIYFNSNDNKMFPNVDKKIHYINLKNGNELFSLWYQNWNSKILKQINNDSNLSFNSIIETSYLCNSIVVQKSNNNDKHKHSLKIESAKKILQPIIDLNNKVEIDIELNIKNGVDDFCQYDFRSLNIERVLIYVQCDDAISCIINILPMDKYIIMNQTNDTLKIDFQFLEYYKSGMKPYLILKKPPQEPSIFPPINHILFMTPPLTPGEEERIISIARRKYSFQFIENQNLFIYYFYLTYFDKNNEIIKDSTVDLKSKSLLTKRNLLKEMSLKIINLHSIQDQQLLF